MNDLLEAIAFEVRELSVDAQFVFDSFPNADNAVYVVIPSQLFVPGMPNGGYPSLSQFKRTIVLCVERQGTAGFETTIKHARAAGAAVHVERPGVHELRRRGVAAEHFQIGYTRLWDRWRALGRARRIDVLYVGAASPRRLQALAAYAGELWRRNSRVLLSTERDRDGDEDSLKVEPTSAVLAQSKVLLGIFRDDRVSFEWPLIVNAICNGCVVVSESAADSAPLLPGEHFLSGGVEGLATLANALLDDPNALTGLRTNAYTFAKTLLPMAPAAKQLVELATDLAVGHRRAWQNNPALVACKTAETARRGRVKLSHLLHGFGTVVASRRDDLLREQAARAERKRILLSEIENERSARRRELELEDVEVEEICRSSAYKQARPRVSVIVPLYNHSAQVVHALRSAARSSIREIELLVLDDGSTDLSRAAAISFLERHQDVPVLLLGHPVNRGLGPTRNALVAAARGEYVLPLDADNELYPSAIGKLLAALVEDPKAFFAYPILEVQTDGVPVGLLAYEPWRLGRLARGGYIDALSLIRRDCLIALGGYTDDIRLYGWEDYDLWCRVAANGFYGVHVPEMLARYTKSDRSMLWVTDHDHTEAFSVLRQRYPEVFVPQGFEC